MTHGHLAEQFGEQLMARRSAAESRRAAAMRAEMAPNSLREIELGLANPTLRQVEAVAALYGCTVRLVVEGDYPHRPATLKGRKRTPAVAR